MPLEIFDFEQNSPEWFQIRLGLATASVFSTILGVKKDSREKATRQTLLRKLAGEIVTGRPMENYSNDYMERGKRLEAEARAHYEFDCIEEVRQVGFLRDMEIRAGCSPDSLVGEDGLLEIKTKAEHILIEVRERGGMPSEHKAQCQGALWVSGRKYVDLFCYCPGLAPYRWREERDEAYIALIADSVFVFNMDLVELAEREMALKKAA